MLLSALVALMAAISAMMLGVGQQNLLLPGLSVGAAMGSFVLTDALGWFRLNRYVANGAMLLAAVLSLNHFLESDSQRQLLAIASLLVYVQIVLLFRQKSRRIFGQLMMFSLLQVVVASLLSSGMEFGVLLAVYMLVALFACAVLFVQRESARTGALVDRRSRRGRQVVPDADGDQRLGGPPVVFAVPSADTSYRQTVRGAFLAPILAMAAASLAFSVVFFYTTPRTGGSGWQRGMGARNVVGFSPEISFDRMGRVLQSDARVMRVSFTNAKSGTPYTLVGEPYFRGAVLTKYLSDRGHGQWRQEVETTATAGLALATPPPVRDLVREDVLLEPTGNTLLFSVFPAYAHAETPSEIRIAARSRKLRRYGVSPRELHDEYRFSIATTAYRFGQQIEVTPHSNRLRTDRDRARLEMLKRRLSYIDSRREFPKLIALAQEIVEQDAADGTTYERAKALERFFLEEDRFQYTLDLNQVQQQRQANVDPIEDFVSNHRMGHCEYFASALTLMLRSQGIPARMVIGYHGGEFNLVGRYYLVRQRDAHAWVEAYLAADEIPADTLYESQRHAGGGWLRLDPTPAADEPLPSGRNLIDRATMGFDYLRWLWNDYVLRLTPGRQQQAVLQPLALDRQVQLMRLFQTRTWRRWWQRLTGGGWREFFAGGLAWRVGLVVTVLLVLAAVGYRLAIMLFPLFATLFRKQRTRIRRRKASRVPFYVRFEHVLARLGVRRRPHQTQREFADVVADYLAQRLPEGEQDLPREIVRRFYQVRFGRVVLSPAQLQQIDRQLHQLAKCRQTPGE